METFRFKDINSADYSVYIADGDAGTSTYSANSITIDTVSALYGPTYSVGQKSVLQNYSLELVLKNGDDEKLKEVLQWLRGEGILSLDAVGFAEKKVIVKAVTAARRLIAAVGFHYTFKVEFQEKMSGIRGAKRTLEAIAGKVKTPDETMGLSYSGAEVTITVDYQGEEDSYLNLEVKSYGFRLDKKVAGEYTKLCEIERTDTVVIDGESCATYSKPSAEGFFAKTTFLGDLLVNGKPLLLQKGTVDTYKLTFLEGKDFNGVDATDRQNSGRATITVSYTPRG